jgi:hypothetical protein
MRVHSLRLKYRGGFGEATISNGFGSLNYSAVTTLIEERDIPDLYVLARKEEK